MGKLAPGLNALALAAALSACGSEAAPAPAPRPTITAPTSTIPSPATSPQPTPPVMPKAATRHTEAGANAFARYFIEAVNYGETTLDTSAISAVSDSTCAACQAGVRSLNEIRRSGGHISGGINTITAVHPAQVAEGRSELVVVSLTVSPETVTLPGQQKQRNPGGKSKKALGLLERPNGWVVGDFRSVQ